MELETSKSGAVKPAVESIGIVKGHYECNYLEQTVPVLSELLALEVVTHDEHEATMKHPNTDWLLIVHESGPEVPDKPFRNHYGVRVTDNREVDRAYEYLMSKKSSLGLKKVVMRNERVGSYSVYFVEPGGNYWEIESYEHRYQAGLPYDVAYPWKKPLSEEQFPGRGYIPQAFTHGTIECNDWASSVKFYKEGLGMDIVTHVVTPKPHNIKHPANSWYVVSLEVPERSRRYLGPLQRFTIAVASPKKLGQACESLSSAARRICDYRDRFYSGHARWAIIPAVRSKQELVGDRMRQRKNGSCGVSVGVLLLSSMTPPFQNSILNRG